MKEKLMRSVSLGILLITTGALFVPSISKNFSTSSTGKYDSVYFGTKGLALSNPHNGWNPDNDVKVYYGKYNNMDMLFRPIKVNDEYVVLDCDNVLYNEAFDKNNSIYYSDSTLEISLACNNYKYYDDFVTNKVGFYKDSSYGRNYISLEAKSNYGIDNKCFDQELERQFSFLLSYDEVKNLYSSDSIRKKKVIGTNTYSSYWLRTAYKHDNGNSGKSGVCIVNNAGQTTKTNNPQDSSIGVSPAVSYLSNYIAYTSFAGFDKNREFGTLTNSNSRTHTLTTISYDNMAVSIINGTNHKPGDKIELDIDTTTLFCPDNFQQISAMLLDLNDKVIAYGRISDKVESGNISFDIPDTLVDGEYKLKVFAEKIKSSKTNYRVDYASNMASFDLNIKKKVETSNLKNVNINVNGKINGITDPVQPKDKNDVANKWQGSKVYFGTYGMAGPLLFRVLDANTSRYGTANTMLLDCDNIIKTIRFDKKSSEDYTNKWKDCQLKVWLNSDTPEQSLPEEKAYSIEYKGGFLSRFSTVEKNALASSTITSSNGLGDGISTEGGCPIYWADLTGEKVFVLDGYEITYPGYGYTNTYDHSVNRHKLRIGYPASEDYLNHNYWLRSDRYEGTYNNIPDCSVVFGSGLTGGASPYNQSYGVSPAINIKLSSILYTTAEETNKSANSLTAVSEDNTFKNRWKLTLLDTSKTFALKDNTKAVLNKKTNLVTLTYKYNDNNDKPVNQISLMITDKEFDKDGVNVLYFGKLNTTLKKNSFVEGTFTLPSNLPAGYHLYMTAENTNNDNYPDYASRPVEVEVVSQNKITYVTKDGTFSKTPIDTYEEGVEFKLPTNITRPGCTFANWFYDEMCTKPIKNNTLPDTTTGDITVYARWASTITYHCGIGFFSDDLSTTTEFTKDNVLALQDKYNNREKTVTYYVGTPGKKYKDSPSAGMKLMSFDDTPLVTKVWEPWSYCAGWYTGDSLAPYLGPFTNIEEITNVGYPFGYYPWVGHVDLYPRIIGNIYNIYLHTNDENAVISDPNWLQDEEDKTLWKMKYVGKNYTGIKYGYEYRYRNNEYTLPNTDMVNIPSGGSFTGWYDNDSFKGTIATKTDKNTGGDKHYYASWMDVKPVIEHNCAEIIGDSLVLYVFASSKIVVDERNNYNPLERTMEPSALDKRNFSFNVSIPAGVDGDAVVWLSTNSSKKTIQFKEVVTTTGGKNNNGNHYGLDNGNVNGNGNAYGHDKNKGSTTIDITKYDPYALNWKCMIDKNYIQDNGDSIYELENKTKAKVTFICPDDATLTQFIGVNASKMLYLHVATTSGTHGVYKVNIVEKVMFEQH